MSEEAKERSRRKLEEVEGTADPEDFVASTGTEKSDNYDPDGAVQNTHVRFLFPSRRESISRISPVSNPYTSRRSRAM